LLAVIVHEKGVPRATTVLVLSVLVTVKSEAIVTVFVSGLDVTPATDAEALLVTKPAETSAAVTV
jgi:hypothetical protein